jgi:hypothetical protein
MWRQCTSHFPPCALGREAGHLHLRQRRGCADADAARRRLVDEHHTENATPRRPCVPFGIAHKHRRVGGS